jgi:hypothetical protein
MLRVSFNLDEGDLEHLADVARRRQEQARAQSAETIIAAAREVLEKGTQAQLADFVKERYSRLSAMIEMVCDPEWQLGADDRQRTLNALACFSAPAASTSATALLDDAIMIELVSRDLQHDLQAYDDFCRQRTSQSGARSAAPGAERDAWLAQRREALQARMHQRRKRDLDEAGSTVRRFFSLFGL